MKIRNAARGALAALLILTGIPFVYSQATPPDRVHIDKGAVDASKHGTRVCNTSGSTIAAGQLVYLSSWSESFKQMLIAKADADVAGARAKFIVNPADILNNNCGEVSSTHRLTGLNTGGSAVGNPVYLSTTAGTWTLTAPTATNAIAQVVGRVAVVSATVGQITFDLEYQNLLRFGSNEQQTGSASVGDGTITGGPAGAGVKLAATTITFDNIANGTITDGKMAASTLTNASIAANTILATKLTSTLRTGWWLIDPATLRVLAANDYQNTAATGGLITTNTSPSILRVNTSTDIGARVTWAATVVAEVQANWFIPPDLDNTSPVIVTLKASMSNTNDTPVVAVKWFEGVGGSNLGGNTGAVTGTTPALYTVSVTSAAAVGNKVALALVPAAHGTDALRLDTLYITYTRK